jgi:hypothetical protein
MTNKEKVERLKQYRLLQLEYRVRNNIYMQLRDKLMFPSATNQTLSDMPSSHNVSNPVENNYIMLENLEAEMAHRVNEILHILQQLERDIWKVTDGLYRTILALRYIEGMSWEKIAVEINYTWRHTHNLHWRAIESIRLI